MRRNLTNEYNSPTLFCIGVPDKVKRWQWPPSGFSVGCFETVAVALSEVEDDEDDADYAAFVKGSKKKV